MNPLSQKQLIDLAATGDRRPISVAGICSHMVQTGTFKNAPKELRDWYGRYRAQNRRAAEERFAADPSNSWRH